MSTLHPVVVIIPCHSVLYSTETSNVYSLIIFLNLQPNIFIPVNGLDDTGFFISNSLFVIGLYLRFSDISIGIDRNPMVGHVDHRWLSL